MSLTVHADTIKTDNWLITIVGERLYLGNMADLRGGGLTQSYYFSALKPLWGGRIQIVAHSDTGSSVIVLNLEDAKKLSDTLQGILQQVQTLIDVESKEEKQA